MGLGRFGHSVTSLGDLNNDGCDGEHAFTSCDDVCSMVDCTTDIAVSAPFDEGGKVFIYYGSKETGINSTVQQASVLWPGGVKSVVIVNTCRQSQLSR